MNPDIEEYLEAHIDPEPEHLYRIDRHTNLKLLNGRMCSGHLQGRILSMLVKMINPERVLELGTFSGYTAICIAEALHPGATIDTIEIDDELEETIRRNISCSNSADKINLTIGNASDILKEYDKETFDLIFIDADKRIYTEYYHLSLPLLKPGGYILADNTLWGGHVVDPGSIRDPQTRGILEFNRMVAEDTGVEKVILPVRDGLTIIRKKNINEMSHQCV